MGDAAEMIALRHTGHTAGCLMNRLDGCQCGLRDAETALARDIRAALTAAETRGRLAGLREAAGASDRANTWYCLAAIDGSLPAGVASGAIIASARIDVAIRKLIEETENG